MANDRYGFELKHVDGSTIVDGSFFNYALHEAGTVIPTSSNSNAIPIHLINGKFPLLALQSYNGIVCFDKMTDTEFDIYTDVRNNPINYQIFGQPQLTQSEYGIEVYNENDIRVFDSAQRYFRIVDIVTVSTPVPIVTYYYYYSDLMTNFNFADSYEDFSHAPCDNPHYLVSNIHGFAGDIRFPFKVPQIAIKAHLGVKNIGPSSGRLGWIQTGSITQGGTGGGTLYRGFYSIAQTIFVVEP